MVVPVVFYCELTADGRQLKRIRGFFDLSHRIIDDHALCLRNMLKGHLST